MRKIALGLALVAGLAGAGISLVAWTGWRNGERDVLVITGGDSAYASEFAYLSENGNSNCSKAFRESIAAMADEEMIRGSCCGPMNMHVYEEQRRGLAAKYATFPEVPQDPYNIPASLAKRMTSHFSDTLSPGQQQQYDAAMGRSRNNGPCCCQCWRWQFYGGLAKYLIQTYGFTGEQVTEVWDFSDGCGGEEDHVYHG